MEVRFVSSLTSEDEERYAPAVLAALAGMLDHTNLAYTIHIRTSGDKNFHHTHTAPALKPTTGAQIDRTEDTSEGNGTRPREAFLPPGR